VEGEAEAFGEAAPVVFLTVAEAGQAGVGSVVEVREVVSAALAVEILGAAERAAAGSLRGSAWF